MATSATIRLKPAARVAVEVRPLVQPVVQRGAERIASLARSYAPKRSGALARSIRVNARGAGGRFTSTSGGEPITSLEVGSNLPYAAYIEHGTSPHPIRVRRASVLTDGVNFFGTEVRHPGNRAYRYLARAASVGFRGL